MIELQCPVCGHRRNVSTPIKVICGSCQELMIESSEWDEYDQEEVKDD